MAVIINGRPIWETAQDNTDFINGIYDRITIVSAQTVRDAIEQLVGAAPDMFDTLEKITDWLLEHEDLYLALVAALADKVDKIAGKQLSTEDFTTEEKIKLGGLFNFIHPLTHSAAMITETSDKKFVTDNEKQKIAEAARVVEGDTLPEDFDESDVFYEDTEV